jgi:hypothetical protein
MTTSWMKMLPHECRYASWVPIVAMSITAVRAPINPTGSIAASTRGTVSCVRIALESSPWSTP